MYIYCKYKYKKLFLKHEQYRNITNTKHDKLFKCTDSKYHALLIEDKTFHHETSGNLFFKKCIFSLKNVALFF